jgi:hypothetical protein
MEARRRLDARFGARRSSAYAERLASFAVSKRNAARFAEKLVDPRLHLRAFPDATDAGVTNAQLLEVLGDYTLTDLGDLDPIPSWGPDVALALRFFSFGSPMAVVTRDIFDMHDLEQTNYPTRTRDLARQLAGLDFLMKRMPHPAGGTYWDHTVVTVVSEFSRNNTRIETGFNAGRGSDHVTEEPDAPSRHQAIPLMGGPVVAAGKGGRLLGATDDRMEALGPVHSSRSLLTTLLDWIGIDTAPLWPDAPIAELDA